MEVTATVTCECNGHSRPYKDIQGHRRSKKHQQWVKENEVFDLRCRCKRLENENESLKYVIDMLKNSATRKTNERPASVPVRVRTKTPGVPQSAAEARVRTPESAP